MGNKKKYNFNYNIKINYSGKDLWDVFGIDKDNVEDIIEFIRELNLTYNRDILRNYEKVKRRLLKADISQDFYAFIITNIIYSHTGIYRMDMENLANILRVYRDYFGMKEDWKGYVLMNEIYELVLGLIENTKTTENLKEFYKVKKRKLLKTLENGKINKKDKK